MVLYILGNGFDKENGLKSGYKCFEKYIETNYPQIKSTYEYAFRGKLWCDFENALSKLDIDYFLDGISKEMFSLGEDQVPLTLKDEWVVKVLQDRMFLSADKLRDLFVEWCNTISCKVDKKFKLCQDDIYINFNYTSLLEDTYKIKDENIYHIHGYTQDGMEMDRIIVGHNVKFAVMHFEPEYEPMASDEFINLADYITDSYQRPVVEKAASFLNEFHKKHSSRYDKIDKFLSNRKIDKICVYGHSLGDADVPYFRYIREKLGDMIPWEFSVYEMNTNPENLVLMEKQISKTFDMPIYYTCIDSKKVSYISI